MVLKPFTYDLFFFLWGGGGGGGTDQEYEDKMLYYSMLRIFILDLINRLLEIH